MRPRSELRQRVVILAATVLRSCYTASLTLSAKASPILAVKEGEAATAAKTHSQKKAVAKIVKLFEEDVAAYGLNTLVIHYIGSKIPAEKWAEEVINPLVGFKARVVPASPVIGVHVGPAVGIAYECKQRIEGKFTGPSPEVVL